MSSSLSIVLPAAMLLFCFSSPAKARDETIDNNLKIEAYAIAEQISDFAKSKKVDAVAIGKFSPLPHLSSSAGSGFAQHLSDALKLNDVRVEKDAPLRIQGTYRDVIDQASRRLAIEIKTTAVDVTGKEVYAYRRGVLGEATIGSLLGLTMEFDPHANDKAREEVLSNAIDKPELDVRGARISSGAKSLYGIEILSKENGQFVARTPVVRDGRAVVSLRRDEVYTVRLINDSPHQAVVNLFIDGLNVFAFSDQIRFTQWLVPARTSINITGWHITNERSDPFRPSEFSRTPNAVKIAPPLEFGTVTASFATAWDQADSAPKDEPSRTPPWDLFCVTIQKSPQAAATFERIGKYFGKPRSIVSVHYK